MTMTVGSLFSGIGGFDLGLERAGMMIKWQVEIDGFCNRVLEKHWPGVRRFRDVRDCGRQNLEPVDLICGGFPCQPYSLAGKRKGQADDRHLWPEMRRIVSELRPRWVIGENVPGIINLELDTVLLDLENLGYAARALIIPACALDAPHIRKRVWIVAHTEEPGTRTAEQHGRSHSLEPRGQAMADAVGFSRLSERRQPQPRSGDCDANRDVADSEGDTARRLSLGEAAAISRPGGGGQNVADADGEWDEQLAGSIAESGDGTGDGGQVVPHPELDAILHDELDEEADAYPGGPGWWATEPRICRVAHGVPHRVDRVKALGNAVVPQVVEAIGRMIISVDGGQER